MYALEGFRLLPISGSSKILEPIHFVIRSSEVYEPSVALPKKSDVESAYGFYDLLFTTVYSPTTANIVQTHTHLS